MRKLAILQCKNKARISCVIAAQLVTAFDFAELEISSLRPNSQFCAGPDRFLVYQGSHLNILLIDCKYAW